ncbi:putative reverse transcriptase domain-containing protein [Tanacetum coccineum]
MTSLIYHRGSQGKTHHDVHHNGSRRRKIGWRNSLEVYLITSKKCDCCRNYKTTRCCSNIANNLMDQKLKGYAVRNAENKRRLNNNYGNNRGQQPPHKRQNTGGQNVARAYMAGNNEKNGYEGTRPFCNKWPNQRVITCFECGAQGHYMKDYPKVKNQNRGNKARVPDARGKAYVLGGGDANPGSNTLTDVSYAVELAGGRTSKTNTVLRGCTLGLLGHPFNIDLMPIDLGSFDVIIGMDWLAKNHAVIVCDEKIVRIPYGNKILIVQGDKSDKEKKSTLSIISCEKA